MKYILIILCSLIINVLNSQVEPIYYYNAKQNTVLAKSGINLRSKPTTKSEVIKHIPFGKKVMLLHKQDYGLDTVDVIRTEKRKYVIQGYWLKVSHGGQTGYVNNAYLYNQTQGDSNNQDNDDYALLFAGSNCVVNVYDVAAYNWYGYYKKDEDCILKEIEIEYGRNALSMTDLSVIVKEDKKLKFIIGSKKVLRTGHINEELDGTNSNEWLRKNSIETYLAYEDPNFKISASYDRGYDYAITIFNNGNSQHIEERWIKDFHTVVWMGDLDGDGEMDYILAFGNKSGQTVLYLSSEKKPGKVAQPVARYYSAYCC